MTCNAWNHTPDCNCGWGGIFHAPADSIHEHWLHFVRHRTPNAVCPACGADVFFYQSPFGGKVYFDELQPPWPKHPCMDSQLQNVRQVAPERVTIPSYLSDPAHRWRPLICKSIKKGNECVELAVAASDDVRTLFGKLSKKVLDMGAPFFIRFVSKGAYEISTLRAKHDEPCEIRFMAFSHFADLVDANRPPTKVKPFGIRPERKPAGTSKRHVQREKIKVPPASVPVSYLNGGEKKIRTQSITEQTGEHARKPLSLPSNPKSLKRKADSTTKADPKKEVIQDTVIQLAFARALKIIH